MISLFIGRFQPFHLGHLNDVKDALKFSDKVIIGIGSSQESKTSENPFSFEERKEMIEKTLEKNNIKDYEITAIPDINDDENWAEHVLSITGKVDVIYTGNDWVERLFAEKKYNVKKVSFLKDINATEIRKRIDQNKNWQELVPKEIEEYIHKIEGVNRIKGLNGFF